jgi:hypothetical protein
VRLDQAEKVRLDQAGFVGFDEMVLWWELRWGRSVDLLD